VREMEDRFNHKHGYPWVFLNEQPFSDDFKRCVPFSFEFMVPSGPDRWVNARTHAQIVAYRLLSRVPRILDRFPRSIGINLRGSMRPGRKRREIRWRRRVSYTVAVYRAGFLFSCSVSA
jgi:Glycolipid 2-alpha-mannosyltransferase